MSIAAIWLNAVTGTGKTKMNLIIEAAAVVVYLVYTFILVKTLHLSLAAVWSNEFVYWLVVFAVSFWFLRRGDWKIHSELM